ncbi:Signal transduction histidine kinase [Nonomuraea jiangxiensis]|uniref:histidine kinase n=1 Tax=Nonomuraea jiangxiensis TaxID=633440 RepID=A0A1G8WGR3_9ACTN|nr:Signal transduction histidine kinase [Nonomuraea jiangxiensis]
MGGGPGSVGGGSFSWRRVAAVVARIPPARAAVAGGVASIAVTLAHPLTGTTGATWWLFAELSVLLALTTLAARRAPAAAVVPGAAISVILLRMVWPGPPSLVLAACAGWSLGAAGAAVAGLYLRSLDGQRHRAVAAAVRDQRLALARDLHDFVAHDVSGMLVQAQAARLVPALPAPVAEALRRIEDGGLRALASLDRTVHLLNEPGRSSAPGIDGLPALADGFSPDVRVELSIDAAGVSRETSAAAYRVVTEALTNVRRHAPAATTVQVAITREGDTVLICVQDDGGAGPRDPARHGGYGLAGLAEVLAAAGGTLTAGAHGKGWRVAAVLPA